MEELATFLTLLVNECCFNMLQHNLHDILYDLCASYIENLWNE